MGGMAPDALGLPGKRVGARHASPLQDQNAGGTRGLS